MIVLQLSFLNIKSMNNENYYIELSKKLIQEKENWDDYNQWTHYYFEKLQENIFNETKVNISSLTLKRYFGKYTRGKDFHMHHITTKDAIALYLGYKSWMAFTKAHTAEKVKDEKKQLIYNYKTNFIKIVKNKRLLLIGFPIVIALLICLFIFNSTNSSVEIKTELNNYTAPTTVKFIYDISKFKSDSIFAIINNKYHIHLNKNDTIFSHYFGHPEYHKIKIINKKNNRLLKEFRLIVKSNDWTRKIVDLTHPKNENFLKFSDDTVGILTITDDELLSQNINPKNYKYHLTFNFFNKFPIKNNTFRFKTRAIIYGAEEGVFYCNYLKLSLWSDNGDLKFFITDTSCYARANIILGNKNITGVNHKELQKLCFIPFKWTEYEIISKDDQMAIKIDDKIIFQDIIDFELNNIFLLQLITGPKGAFDYIKFYNENDELIYYNEFDKNIPVISNFAN
jgi:hypothetical protein